MILAPRATRTHTRSTLILVLAGTALAASSIASSSDSPFDLIERANLAYREGSLQRAITLYEEADDLGADDPLTLYNWGTALTATDERGLAERMFRKADEFAQSDELRARARFNLAHSLFVTASTLTEEDPRRAIELFDDSAKAAKAALRIDRGDSEAASHVEISHMAAQLVRDQLELAERLQELADRQRDQSHASQDAHQQQEQDQQDATEPNQQENEQPQDPPEQPEQSPEQSDEQGELSEDTPSDAQPLGDSNSPPDDGLAQAQEDLSTETEGIAETLRRAIDNDLVAGDRDFVEAVLRAIEEARDSQDDATEDLDQERFDEAASNQEQAASLLEMAEQKANRMRADQPRDSQDPRQDDTQEPQSGGNDPIEDEQAQQLLEKERDEREMRRNFQRRIMRGRRGPARDW